MSDDRENGSQSQMTDRLASLRDSIKASQPRVPKVGKPVALEPEAPPAPVEPETTKSEQSTTGDLHRVAPSDESVPEDATFVRNVSEFVSVQGTPLYMSPEQCRDDEQTAQTDVYSLGVMMFELLEGAPPFVAPTVDEVLYKHLDAPVPEQRSTFTPDDVKALVTRMLSKEPADRPDMTDVITLLQEHVFVGGADVLGLEEESWSVSEIEESTPQEDLGEAAGSGLALPAAEAAEASFFNPLQVAPSPDATMDIDEFDIIEDDRKPIWILWVLTLVVFFAIGALFVVGGNDEDTGESETVGEESAPKVAAEEPVAPDPVAPEPAIAQTEDAGLAFADEPDLGPPEQEVVEVEPEVPAAEPEPEPELEPEPEPKPKPKPKPRKKRPTKKAKPKPKLQELRL